MRLLSYITAAVLCLPAGVMAQKADTLDMAEKGDTLDIVEEKDTVIPTPKPNMRFALLLPLYLEDNFREDTAGAEPAIDGRSLSALHFYEGALMARKELKQEGLQLELPVLDISSGRHPRIVLLLNYQELKSCDLVISNFPPSECDDAIGEAARIGVPLALTKYGTREMIRETPGAILMSSPPFVQCRLMAATLARSDSARNYMVLSRTENRENELADAFVSVLDTAVVDTALEVIEGIDDVITKVLARADTVMPPVIIIPSSDESYVSSLLNRIDTLGVRMEIVGLPTWEHFETLRFGKYSNLHVRIFSSTWFDMEQYQASFRKRFLAAYRTDPLPSAYQAYEFCMRTARLIGQDVQAFPSGLPGAFADSGLFQFMRVGEGGHMNVRIKVLEYEAFSLRSAEQ